MNKEFFLVAFLAAALIFVLYTYVTPNLSPPFRTAAIVFLGIATVLMVAAVAFMVSLYFWSRI